MKFICDVHISYKIVAFLIQSGYQAIHVNNILAGCFSTDKSIMEYADENDFIVITKDADFRNSFHLFGKPKKLIKVSLGNISTILLIELLSTNLKDIDKLNHFPRFCVELGIDSTIVFLPE